MFVLFMFSQKVEAVTVFVIYFAFKINLSSCLRVFTGKVIIHSIRDFVEKVVQE